MPVRELSESLKYLSTRRPIPTNAPPSVFNDDGTITREFLDCVGRRAGLLYRGDNQLARVQLAREFNLALSGCKNINDLQQRVATLISYLGHSDFAFIQWGMLRNNDRLRLKHLFGSYPCEILEHVCTLFRATMEGKPSNHLISRFHLEQQAVFTSDGGYQNQECYVLISRVGNYGYILPNTIYRQGKLSVALSVVSEGLDAEDFRYHMETNQIALNLLANEVNMAGARQFPVLFESNVQVIQEVRL